MDFEIFFHSIMTDAKGSKSNIAAKFQNALSLHVLPPIGVFWDIENCQVPKGKSAIALVQNIREKFFAQHREAEFMCVCDINKERKTVIQELILAQVTVVHISATSKNAADDKLKQCMRRFVDTHGAPSTLLLISDDVNFSSDLSDFRHRHNIRIILIHRGRAHQSLLACAHEHYDFSTIASDLPSRHPAKSPDRRPTSLVVTDLPTNRSVGQVRTVLRKLSQNCGGKVSEVRGNKAIVKFATPDAAERAQKRMDKEFLYGHEISVNFCHANESDFNVSPFKRTKGFVSSNEVSATSSSSRDSSASPPVDQDPSTLTREKFDFPPPPVLDSQTIPSFLPNHISLKENQTKDYKNNPSTFPDPPNMELFKDNKNFQLDWNFNKIFSQASNKTRDISAFTPFRKEIDSRMKLPQKNVGRVTPFLMHECDKNGRSTHSDPGVFRSLSNKFDNTSNSYLFNHGYQNSVQNISSSYEIQNEPYFYSPTWNGTAAVSDTALPIPRNNPASSLDGCVELHVSNLDPAFEVNDLKRILLSVFTEHVMVLHVSMSLQPDGTPKATVKVPSLQDAQYAISRLHRRKIGHKRILISHMSSNKIPPFHILKSETIALLNDIPNKSLPLIKFRELYEKRYHRPIAVSELYKMREAVSIQGDSGSRIVYLNTEYCNTPSIAESEDSQECSIVERPYCEVHFQVSASQGWAEQYNICPLPLVHISLKLLATAVHRLLDSHQGSLPLISFCDCYEAEIGPLPIVGNFTASKEDTLEVSLGANQISVTNKDPKGVPLEHLIACITGVEVAKSILCIKKVQWLENKIDALTLSQNFSPALLGQLTLFGREVIDLLKSQPQCLVQFNKFIPTYHHHFGRQCRVADYGFTKLIDLLEAIPHIVQVIGEGQNRQVTLTHRTQVKRFAAELLRILKARASKQIAVSEFALAYEQVIEKPFEITNYGVCEIEDMLNEVPENVVVTSGTGTETIISIPKREQTVEEVERTKLFAEEVIELMKHTTNCSMAFNKFIPSYHHHFGKQCRVADYGFSKLIELFEVIPDILEVTGTGEDKILQLVEKEQHKILTERLVTVLKSQSNEMVDITDLCEAYVIVHGYALRPSDFGFVDLEELLEKFSKDFKVVECSGKKFVYLINHELIDQISQNVKKVLMEQKGGTMSIKDLCALYQERFHPKIDISPYISDLTCVIQIANGYLQLTPSQLLARAIIALLQDHGAPVPLSSLSSLFQQKYGVSLNVTDYGFQSMSAMLEHFCDYFVLRGKRQKRVVCLRSEASGYLSSNEDNPSCSVPAGKKFSNLDIFSQPVPSCIPTPTIVPRVNESFADLMGFETPPIKDMCYALDPSYKSSKRLSSIKPSESMCKNIGLVPSIGEMPVHKSFSTISDVHSPLPFNVSSNVSLQSSSKLCDKNFSVDSHQKVRTLSCAVREESNSSAAKSVPQFDLPFNIKLENSCTVELEEHNGFGHFISNSSISQCLIDSPSYNVATKYNNHSFATKDASSTKNSPTNESKQSRRSRIAAQFSSPINN